MNGSFSLCLPGHNACNCMGLCAIGCSNIASERLVVQYGRSVLSKLESIQFRVLPASYIATCIIIECGSWLHVPSVMEVGG